MKTPTTGKVVGGKGGPYEETVTPLTRAKGEGNSL